MKLRAVLFQLVLLAVIVPLSYGPVGHYWNLRGGAPDLLLISVWALSWLTDLTTALVWAILLGVTADLLSFWPFGLWTAVFVGLTLLTHFLKSRFFAVSSVLEALVTLLICNVLMVGVEFLLTGTLLLGPLFISLLANVLIGLVLYYVLVMRYRLTERWEGRRL